MGLFDKLKKGLAKTRQVLQTDVRDLFRAGELLGDGRLEEFEAKLIRTDMGVAAAAEIVTELREKFGGRTVVVDDIWSTVQERLKLLLRGSDGVAWNANEPLSPLRRAGSGPTVVLVSGVNGVGKTTTIAKLASLVTRQENRVVLAAGDTYRAAAVEQLTMWSERIGCEIVTREMGTDPASVAWSACERALETQADFVIVDTAGRLQTQKNLMDELTKINRVIAGQIPDGPHERLLVIDATTGQNGLSQARNFSQAVDCTGIVLAKLDGTARGGVVVAIRQQMGMPVKYVGVGEQIDDLEVFDPDGFVEALFAA